jgi:hypothetical protein
MTTERDYTEEVNTYTSEDAAAIHGVLPTTVTSLIVLVGPALCARLIIANRTHAVFALPHALTISLALVVGVLWSPLFISIPAALMQFARDRALASMGESSSFSPMNLVRGVCLVPYLMFSKNSPVRTAMCASVIGWVAGLVIAAPYLHGLSTLHFGF